MGTMTLGNFGSHTTTICASIQNAINLPINEFCKHAQSIKFIFSSHHLLLFPPMASGVLDKFLSMFSPSVLVIQYLLHHLSGWYFLSSITRFCLISRNESDIPTCSISKASIIGMLLIEINFLPGDMVFLSYYTDTLGNHSVGDASTYSGNESVPSDSLSSSPSNYPLSLSPPFFSVLSHCETSAAHPIQSPILPLLSASGTTHFALPTKASLTVRNGLPINLLPFVEVASIFGG